MPLSCCGTPTPRGSRRTPVAHAPAGRSLLLAGDARDTDPGPEPTGLPPRPVGPPFSPAAGRSYDTAATEATSAAGDGERAAVVELGLGRIVALY